jgi:hypothetical protein
MKTQKSFKRCEGYHRTGGAFTLGPVVWTQCKGRAIAMLTVIQDKKEFTLPSCPKCWRECIEKNIKIIKAEPIEA